MVVTFSGISMRTPRATFASHQVLGECVLERCAQCRVHPLDHARAHPGIAHVVDHDPYIADGQPVQLFSPDAGHKV